jgi:hypothetical protein
MNDSLRIYELLRDYKPVINLGEMMKLPEQSIVIECDYTETEFELNILDDDNICWYIGLKTNQPFNGNQCDEQIGLYCAIDACQLRHMIESGLSVQSVMQYFEENTESVDIDSSEDIDSFLSTDTNCVIWSVPIRKELRCFI